MNTASPGSTSRIELEPDHVERHALRRDHPLDAVGGLAHAEHERPDSVRVAERDDCRSR